MSFCTSASGLSDHDTFRALELHGFGGSRPGVWSLGIHEGSWAWGIA